ncbi:MAG: hypothetical protein M1835_006702 [Candelina submexicana]|nr:MAG: hypothetical protein M1835_006702 [Candelina submexicana]
MAVRDAVTAPYDSATFNHDHESNISTPTPSASTRQKLHGRAFYESIGSPRMILAPMVDQSEFAWRMLTRSFMTPETSKSLLAYSPMLHSRLFGEKPKFRESHFQPLRNTLPSPPDSDHASEASKSKLYLDGNPAFDRPLVVQFCANSPDELLEAARHVQPFCDAVDLNLGCPQGIARKGHYGAFLQEEWDLVYNIINKLHRELDIPVTAKIRILETKEKTLEYAKKLLAAGASIITVHGRMRDQKGHNTGLADWSVIRYLRDNLPPETVIFANGNVLTHDDLERCLAVTGADGVMSAEGNLYDPAIFSEPPPIGKEGRDYWRGRDGKGGYRMDAVFRRYMDIIYKYVLEVPLPERRPLYLPTDPEKPSDLCPKLLERREDPEGQPPVKKQKRDKPPKVTSPNLIPMQAHLFHMLRPIVSKHTNIRDALAKCRPGDMAAFEGVLTLVEEATKAGIQEYEVTADQAESSPQMEEPTSEQKAEAETSDASSLATVARVKRPWWVCQPYVRPLPKEALEKGALSLSRKEKARLEREDGVARQAGLTPEGRTEPQALGDNSERVVDIPREGVVCG